MTPEQAMPDAFDLDVTEDDIRGGVAYNAWQCPIAHALERSFAGSWAMVFTINATIVFDYPSIAHHRYEHDGWEFIGEFDRRRTAAPTRIHFTRMHDHSA